MTTPWNNNKHADYVFMAFVTAFAALDLLFTVTAFLLFMAFIDMDG